MKKLSEKQINSIYRKISDGGLVVPHSPTESFPKKNEGWVVVGGSSKQNNKLVDVSTWQIGQGS